MNNAQLRNDLLLLTGEIKTHLEGLVNRPYGGKRPQPMVEFSSDITKKDYPGEKIAPAEIDQAINRLSKGDGYERDLASKLGRFLEGAEGAEEELRRRLLDAPPILPDWLWGFLIRFLSQPFSTTTLGTYDFKRNQITLYINAILGLPASNQMIISPIGKAQMMKIVSVFAHEYFHYLHLNELTYDPNNLSNIIKESLATYFQWHYMNNIHKDIKRLIDYCGFHNPYVYPYSGALCLERGRPDLFAQVYDASLTKADSLNILLSNCPFKHLFRPLAPMASRINVSPVIHSNLNWEKINEALLDYFEKHIQGLGTASINSYRDYVERILAEFPGVTVIDLVANPNYWKQEIDNHPNINPNTKNNLKTVISKLVEMFA